MAAPPRRQSTRQRKPTIPFGAQITQPLELSKPEPSEPKCAYFKSSKHIQKVPIVKAKEDKHKDDIIELLCNQTKVLDI